jgi:hypothetical protein
LLESSWLSIGKRKGGLSPSLSLSWLPMRLLLSELLERAMRLAGDHAKLLG